jgi:hypothetical protein
VLCLSLLFTRSWSRHTQCQVDCWLRGQRQPSTLPGKLARRCSNHRLTHSILHRPTYNFSKGTSLQHLPGVVLPRPARALRRTLKATREVRPRKPTSLLHSLSAYVLGIVCMSCVGLPPFFFNQKLVRRVCRSPTGLFVVCGGRRWRYACYVVWRGC